MCSRLQMKDSMGNVRHNVLFAVVTITVLAAGWSWRERARHYPDSLHGGQGTNAIIPTVGCPQVLTLDEPLPEVCFHEADLSDVITFIAISSRCLGTKISLSADEQGEKILYKISVIGGNQSVLPELPRTGIPVTLHQDAGKTMYDLCLSLAKFYDLRFLGSDTNLTFIIRRFPKHGGNRKGADGVTCVKPTNMDRVANSSGKTVR